MISIHSHQAKNAKYNLWLIHGYGESHACFEQVHQSPLAMEANIFSFDLPGFGAAPLATTDHETYLHELAQRVEAHHADLPCVLLGHSMGGIFATLLAAQLNIPQVILLVVDSSLSSDQSPITNGNLGNTTPEDFKSNLLVKLKAQLATAPDIARLVSQVEASTPEALFYWANEGTRARTDDRVLNLFLTLPHPKYYLIGKHSFSLPIRERLLTLLAQYLVWFPDAGHWIMLDIPEAFWQRVGALISNHL